MLACLGALSLLGVRQLLFGSYGDSESCDDLTRAGNRSEQRIPHHLFFTHRVNLIEEGGLGGDPKWSRLHANVLNTIGVYKRRWGEEACDGGSGAAACVEVRFLLDDGCREAIRLAEPQLLGHFDREPQGMYKADICRVSALYVHGGYYFDADLRAVEAVDLEGVDGVFPFATVLGYGADGFFQAFLAAQAGHPVLRAAMDAMLRYYQGGAAAFRKKGLGPFMGPATLRAAYWSVDAARRGRSLILQKTKLAEFRKRFGPNRSWVLEQDGEGCCCNYVVYDSCSWSKTIHFFSRIVGAGEACTAPSSQTH